MYETRVMGHHNHVVTFLLKILYLPFKVGVLSEFEINVIEAVMVVYAWIYTKYQVIFLQVMFIFFVEIKFLQIKINFMIGNVKYV